MTENTVTLDHTESEWVDGFGAVTEEHGRRLLAKFADEMPDTPPEDRQLAEHVYRASWVALQVLAAGEWAIALSILAQSRRWQRRRIEELAQCNLADLDLTGGHRPRPDEVRAGEVISSNGYSQIRWDRLFCVTNETEAAYFAANPPRGSLMSVMCPQCGDVLSVSERFSSICARCGAHREAVAR